MAQCGIVRIDALLGGQGQALAAGDADTQAVGALQDLLLCHGAAGLPGLLSNTHGQFGPLTTQFEGAGRFAAANRNTDKAGLSFGLIQWAQKPGRLNELLLAFRQKSPKRFLDIFGEGDAALADGLIAHTAKTRGGTDDLGRTTDQRYDLIAAPWAARFSAAALDPALQRIQVSCAMEAFRRSLTAIRAYAKVKSERGIAFMLDLANQHGDAGAKSIYGTVPPVADEPALLLALENESVRRIEKQFGTGSSEAVGGRDRRRAFRTSTSLSDAPFIE